MSPFWECWKLVDQDAQFSFLWCVKILSKRLLELITSIKSHCTQDGYFSLVLNFSAFLHSTRTKFGEQFYELHFRKLEELRVIKQGIITVLVSALKSFPENNIIKKQIKHAEQHEQRSEFSEDAANLLKNLVLTRTSVVELPTSFDLDNFKGYVLFFELVE